MHHLRLVRPANDTARLDADITAHAVEERARAMVVALFVTPDGVRALWCEGDPSSSRPRLTAAS